MTAIKPAKLAQTAFNPSGAPLPTREEAVKWAARIAKACHCDQELRVFGFDPQS